MTARVQSLHRYPVKSCGGEDLQAAPVGPRGIVFDREWMVVGEQGLFLTQRTLPRMCLIHATIQADALRLQIPDVGAKTVPLQEQEGRPLDVLVWKDLCRAVDQGDEMAGWLSDFLKFPCRLVRMARDHVRPAKHDDFQVGFADGYSFLVISQASLDWLNRELLKPLPMNRFRPNIVLAGHAEPFLEDACVELQSSDVRLIGMTRCVRCPITTTDQASGERGKEPLATLAKHAHRRGDGGVAFGRNFNHVGAGWLRVGDVLTVI